MKEDNNAAAPVYQAEDSVRSLYASALDYMYAKGFDRPRDSPIIGSFGTPRPGSRGVYQLLLRAYYLYLKTIDKEGYLDQCEDGESGELEDQELLWGKRVSLDFLQSIEDFITLQKLWSFTGSQHPPRLIVELGGGYGRLAYVCRKLMPECTYVLLDLPEALVCANTWLSSVLPKGHVAPYRTARALKQYSPKELSQYPVWTLGAHAIEKLQQADLFISLYAFDAMAPASTSNYLSEIDRLARTFYARIETSQCPDRSDGSKAFAPRSGWREVLRQPVALYSHFEDYGFLINHSE